MKIKQNYKNFDKNTCIIHKNYKLRRNFTQEFNYL